MNEENGNQNIARGIEWRKKRKMVTDNRRKVYMGELKNALMMEQKRLEKMWTEVQRQLKDVPDGSLRISIDKGL